jgi:hypothetical protein
VIEISVILVWLGCLNAYLSSENQKFIQAKFKKTVGWVGFAILILAAIFNASMIYSFIVSSLIVFILVMLCWVCIVIFNGHKSFRLLPIGILCMLVISMLVKVV